jgi:hypothetical protein
MSHSTAIQRRCEFCPLHVQVNGERGPVVIGVNADKMRCLNQGISRPDQGMAQEGFHGLFYFIFDESPMVSLTRPNREDTVAILGCHREAALATCCADAPERSLRSSPWFLVFGNHRSRPPTARIPRPLIGTVNVSDRNISGAYSRRVYLSNFTISARTRFVVTATWKQ